ncbi:MAG: hypothetical protein WAL01_07895 [Pseudolabrys sp.]
MNNSIFHAKTLQTEVFGSVRRLVEIEKYFVHRIPTGDDLVDLLIADCLPQNRKSPEQFGTGTFQKITQPLDAVSIFGMVVCAGGVVLANQPAT